MSKTRTAASSPTRTGRVLTSLTALGGVALGSALTAPASPAGAAGHRGPDVVQQSIDRLVRADKFPGAMASVRQADGRVRDYTAGVADLTTSRRMPVDGRVRIASNTKMFTATVLLQLVGEGKVELDRPVETYLPGVVRGEGIDGREITVRHLLQQTSGLADYDDEIFADFLNALHTYHEPHDLLRVAFAKKPETRPGSTFVYSNTNYILAGLIVQEVTGRPVGEQITQRIIKPLGLRGTYWPADGETTIRGAHPRGYVPAVEGKAPVDITESDPSGGWAAGALVGPPSDINRFLAALLGGKLLAPAQLAEMQRTVDAPGFDTVGGSRYGLGLATFKLSCGGFAWTHGGIAPGYVTYVGIAPSGRAASIAVTSMIAEQAAAEHLDKSLDTALCA
jgi:D-alanyl-D-alanine carboxypeptidase